MERSEALQRLTSAPVGRLATITADGRPHIVPITFAVLDNAVVHMVDDKPKTRTDLVRLANLRANPQASLLVDHYEKDWRRLWWVRVDGTGAVHESGREWEKARSALVEKYSQYSGRPPMGPAVYLSVERVTGWAYTG